MLKTPIVSAAISFSMSSGEVFLLKTTMYSTHACHISDLCIVRAIGVWRRTLCHISARMYSSEGSSESKDGGRMQSKDATGGILGTIGSFGSRTEIADDSD